MQFKGREMAHKENGELILLKFSQIVEEHGVPEALPKLEGKKMIMFFKPKK